MFICHNCKKEVEIEGKIMREELCPYCNAYLHCCMNCKFYDEYAHNKCREPRSEWVSDREKGNFCTYFQPRDSEQDQSAQDRRKDAEEKLKKLFGKKDEE
jgi:hypothetical protein